MSSGDEASRPVGWRRLLAEARNDLPSTTVLAETVAADVLLSR